MRALVAAAAAALVLSACQDPAGVGLGLIDEEQLDPTALVVPLGGFALFNDSTVAIGIAQANPSGSLAQPRALAGTVADPVYGDVRSIAYLDFLRGDGVPDGATAADVSEVWLELARVYAYGDTTTALPLEIRQITEDWEIDREYAPNRTFTTGAALSTTTVAVGDTLPRFDLPTAWVRQNAGVLIGEDFSDDFEGLALQTPAGFAPAPGVVWGFQTFESTGSALRVVVDGDTLAYPLSEVFSSIDVQAATAPPATAAAARASSQRALQFDVDLASVGTAALAQARLQLPLETDLAEVGPFVRPLVTRAFLFGIRGTGADRERSFLSEVTLDTDRLVVQTPLALTNSVQEILLGSSTPFDAYELAPDPTQASLDILPVRLPTAGGSTPRLTLTIVGGQQ